MKLTAFLDKAQYLPGDTVKLTLNADVGGAEVTLTRLEQAVPCVCQWEGREIRLPGLPEGCYGLTVTAAGARWEGAFDIVHDRRGVTRYAFLSDFGPGDGNPEAVQWLRGLHFNAIQFYDWMYRHDALLPPADRFRDPLGREMDLGVIREKIAVCKASGIRPVAYGAIYAADKERFQAHPEWGMYTLDGQPMTFAGWLYYMNIARSCGWSDHILEEYRKAIAFGFSGIHMDTYGFPKQVWDNQHRPVDLSEEIPTLIDRAAAIVRREDPESGVIFNAVNNWPMEAVAQTGQDAVYIEVWPPNDRYRDLYTLIAQARRCSGKPVVLAAYLKAFLEPDQARAERAFRLCWAAIHASGGTQLVLGENRAVLRDSYYANYAPLRAEFLPVVQKYCDFIVRYGELTLENTGVDISRTASDGINEDVRFTGGDCVFSTDAQADTVWTILREEKHRLSLHLVNLRGNDDRWNAPKAQPVLTEHILLHLRLDRSVTGIYAASPDGDSLAPESLLFTWQDTPQGRIYTAELPPLAYWMTLWVLTEV